MNAKRVSKQGREEKPKFPKRTLSEELRKTIELVSGTESRREARIKLFQGLNEKKFSTLDFAVAIREHSMEDRDNLIELLCEALPQCLGRFGEEEISILIGAYAYSQDDYSAGAVADVLGKFGNKSCVELFKSETTDMWGDDDEVQGMAILALDNLMRREVGCADVAVDESLRSLAKAITSDDPKVVRRAAHGLSEWRLELAGENYNPEVSEYLTRLLEGMLRNPSKSEREMLSTIFNGLLEGMYDPIYQRVPDFDEME